MAKIAFEHGGDEYDRRYPDGIPTSVVIESASSAKFDSGLVMYPSGHARNTTTDLKAILAHKFDLLGALATREAAPIIERFNRIAALSRDELAALHDFAIDDHGRFD